MKPLSLLCVLWGRHVNRCSSVRNTNENRLGRRSIRGLAPVKGARAQKHTLSRVFAWGRGGWKQCPIDMQWAKATDAVKHPVVCRTAPLPQHGIIQAQTADISSTKVEKPWFRAKQSQHWIWPNCTNPWALVWTQQTHADLLLWCPVARVYLNSNGWGNSKGSFKFYFSGLDSKMFLSQNYFSMVLLSIAFSPGSHLDGLCSESHGQGSVFFWTALLPILYGSRLSSPQGTSWLLIHSPSPLPDLS